jgi:hypothetical protein
MMARAAAIVTSAAADQGFRAAEAPMALIGGDVTTAGGLDQWAGQWGGWYLPQPPIGSTQPIYGPNGPYPSLQTAAFFGATSSFHPLAAGAFATQAPGSNLNTLNLSDTLNVSGLAPGAGLTLNQLATLGIGVPGPGIYTIAGQTLPLVPSQSLANTSIAAFLGFPNQFFAPTPFMLGAIGLGFGR